MATLLTSVSDQQLVEAFATGNNEAFDVLLERHQSSIFTYIYHIVRDRDVANDIFQDAFMKAICTIKDGRYAESGKFKSWMLRIAHNLTIDYFRAERNQNTISNDATEYDLLNNMSLCDETIESHLVCTQIQHDVKRLVSHLPSMQREVLEMRYYHNMSFKEIADSTGVSINTALGRVRYAIINIRKMATEAGISLSVI